MFRTKKYPALLGPLSHHQSKHGHSPAAQHQAKLSLAQSFHPEHDIVGHPVFICLLEAAAEGADYLVTYLQRLRPEPLACVSPVHRHIRHTLNELPSQGHSLLPGCLLDAYGKGF